MSIPPYPNQNIKEGIVCQSCKGTSFEKPQWITDESNNGYWKNKPCYQCNGTGLHHSLRELLKKVDDMNNYNSFLVFEKTENPKLMHVKRVNDQDGETIPLGKIEFGSWSERKFTPSGISVKFEELFKIMQKLNNS